MWSVCCKRGKNCNCRECIKYEEKEREGTESGENIQQNTQIAQCMPQWHVMMLLLPKLCIPGNYREVLQNKVSSLE